MEKMTGETYRITAAVDTELMMDFDEMLAKHHIYLRGKAGVAKIIYTEMVTDIITDILKDKKLQRKYINRIIDITGKGKSNFLAK